MHKSSLQLYFKKLPVWYDPADVFVTLFGNSQYAFWLDSSKDMPGFSRFSYMGEKSGSLITRNVFSVLEQNLQTSILQVGALPFDFIGGFVGYFAYEMPDACFFFVERFLVFDHEQHEVFLVYLAETEEKATHWFSGVEQKIQLKGMKRSIESPQKSTIHFVLARNKAQYLKDIETCKEFLARGESYQLCLTNTISVQISLDWLAVYLRLRQTNPAPYSAYFRCGDLAILSSSPERFLKIDMSGQVETKPIKGTRPRGKTPEEDKQIVQELLHNKKDWSENAMIVDLLRNDLGKVCKFGSIQVKKFLDVETYQTVHQLVSTVTGSLREDITVIDCIKACFPGGSMTGAPKIRAMEVLADLEKQPRGIYSGAFGFLSLNKTVDLSIVIRTIVATKNSVTIGTGGAILIDSDPEQEYEEMLLKARVLMETIANAHYTV